MVLLIHFTLLASPFLHIENKGNGQGAARGQIQQATLEFPSGITLPSPLGTTYIKLATKTIVDSSRQQNENAACDLQEMQFRISDPICFILPRVECKCVIKYVCREYITLNTGFEI